jgi:hypothetical protein
MRMVGGSSRFLIAASSLSIFASALSGCGKDDESKSAGAETVTGPFLTAAQLNPASFKASSADEAKKEINSINEVYPQGSDAEKANEDAENAADEDDEFSKCLLGKLEQIQVEKNGQEFTAGFSIKDLNCKFSQGSLTINTFKIFTKGTCSKLSAEGKAMGAKTSFKSVEDKNPCEKNTSSSSIFQSEMTATLTFSSALKASPSENDLANATTKITVYSNESGKDFSACEDGIVEKKNCVATEVTKSVVSTKDGKILMDETSLVQRTENNLKGGAKADKYYSGGSFDLKINGWTGALTFTGAQTPPTFSMVKGSEKVTGTHGEGSGTNPTDGSDTTTDEGDNSGAEMLVFPSPEQPLFSAKAISAAASKALERALRAR